MSGLTLAIALAAALVMGFAIQRGATCTVAAVDDLVSHRSAGRLVAMAEASLWVAGGLLLARALGALPMTPSPYAVTGWTVAGGLLLGLGAWVNGACVFGAIARFGSGEWAFAATPVGYFAGCATVGLFGMAGAHKSGAESPLFHLPSVLLLALSLPFVVRAGQTVLAARSLRGRAWTPHLATTVIGLAFVVTLLARGGAWAYTDLLSDVASRMPQRLAERAGLFLALWTGAVLGGWQGGRLRSVRPTGRALMGCFAGGALMAWGSLLVPGANDGLVLVGMPLLWPYAWLAFASMVLAIAGAIYASRLVQPGWVAGGAP